MLGLRKVLYCLESIILDYGTNMKRVRNQIRNQIQDQTFQYVHTQVRDEIIGQVWNQVDVQSVYRLWIYVFMLEQRKVLGDGTFKM